MIYILFATNNQYGKEDFITADESLSKCIEIWNAENPQCDYGTMYGIENGVKTCRADYLPLKLTFEDVMSKFKPTSF